MECKQCNRPIFVSIEGELICELCWAYNQQDDESRAVDAAIDEYLNEQWKEAQELIKQGLCCVCEEPMNNSPVGHKCWYLA